MLQSVTVYDTLDLLRVNDEVAFTFASSWCELVPRDRLNWAIVKANSFLEVFVVSQCKSYIYSAIHKAAGHSPC